eukprot:TRINITY_DN2789_c0_g1_i12.p1 TRINITY_DN2789_c0_g1~~TRINITY_DN2789_c0_g1_i12.p1  ORF type:complete len:454 (+),score=54.92 TRINITY_DN2789_c0_g1_i12:1131-2492(+)
MAHQPAQQSAPEENLDGGDTEVFDVDPNIFQEENGDDWIDVRQQQFLLRGQSGSLSSSSSGLAHSTTFLTPNLPARKLLADAPAISHRAIIHIDLDCFFVQVEQSLNPKLKGRAVAVHQHEDIISVSYEARALGVKKHMTPAEAVVASKGEVVLVPVQTEHGSKVSYRVYREASSQIIEAVKTCTFLRTALFEKASIDEFFVDVSDPCALKVSSSADPEVDVLSTTTGINVESQTSEYSPQQIQLLHNNWPPCVIFGDVSGVLLPEEECLRSASFLALQIRDMIQARLGFSCSAGVAPNKLLAKIASGLNKPHNQTVILHRNVAKLMSTIPLRKLPRVLTRAGHRALADLEALYGVWTCGDLVQDDVHHSRIELISRYGEATGDWLYTRARGEDDDPVKEKPPQKTLACSMSLTPFGPNHDQLSKIFNMIASELSERLRKDVRGSRRSCATRC